MNKLLNLFIFIAVAVTPWLLPSAVRPLTGLAGLALWFVLIRPTWRGLLPFYATAALALNVMVQAVSLLWLR